MNTRFYSARVALVAGWLAALAAPAAAQTTPNTLTAAERSAGWMLLFDGKSTDGWRGYKKADAAGARWVVNDGLLCVDAETGKDTRGARDIITKDTFDQFELSWEWRVAQGGNSGLKYFVLEDLDAAIGHEYQIIDDERHADAKVGPKRQTAALYDVLAASNRPVKPAGEFNQSKVVVSGKTVQHWLNGTKVLQYELESDALKQAITESKFKNVERFGKLHKAHVLLQDHGDAVCYRNVKIRPAAKSSSKTSQ
jgi:hypothetical protein